MKNKLLSEIQKINSEQIENGILICIKDSKTPKRMIIKPQKECCQLFQTEGKLLQY